MTGANGDFDAHHQEAFELLPWYVNGTLSAEEQAKVGAHLSDCLVCRREVDLQRGLARRVKESDVVPVSASSGFSRLSERLDGPRGRTEPSRWRRLRTYALAAAAALAVLAAGLNWLLSRSEFASTEPEYRTLSKQEGVQPAGDNRIRVILDGATGEAQALDFLAELGIVVTGADRAGTYVIDIGDRSVEDTLAALRSDPRVRYAETALVISDSER